MPILSFRAARLALLSFVVLFAACSAKDSPELVAAVTRGDITAVERLLKEGANPNSRGGDQNRPVLAHAAVSGNVKIVEALLRAGADAKASHNSFSPLMWTTMGGTQASSAIEIVTMLVGKGADIDEQDSQGQTALHRSLRNVRANARLAIALVAMGARTDIKDKNGKTPLSMAIEGNAPEDVVNALKDPVLAKRLALTRSEATERAPSRQSRASNPSPTDQSTSRGGKATVEEVDVSTPLGQVSLSTSESPGIGNKPRKWVVTVTEQVIHTFDSRFTPDFFVSKTADKKPLVVESGNVVTVAVATNDDYDGKGCGSAFLVVLQRNSAPGILQVPNECRTLMSAQSQEGKILFFLYGDKEPSIAYQDGAFTNLAFARAMATCKSLMSRPDAILESYNRIQTRDVGVACQKATKEAPNDGEAIYLLGRYEDYVTWDFSEAVKTYRVSADKGHSEALAALGRLYVLGLGGTKDLAEAVKLWRLAAEKGSGRGLTYLGNAYAKGEGVARDYPEALRLWRLAAEKENALAMRNIGILYFDGNGVAKDLQEARRWFVRAEEVEPGMARDDLALVERAETSGTNKVSSRSYQTSSDDTLERINRPECRNIRADAIYNLQKRSASPKVRQEAEGKQRERLRNSNCLPEVSQRDTASEHVNETRQSASQPATVERTDTSPSVDQYMQEQIKRKQCDQLSRSRALQSSNPAAREQAKARLREFGCI